MTEFKIINSIDEINLSNKWNEVKGFESAENIVNNCGETPKAEYNGRLYRLVAVRERKYTTKEKFGRRFLGVVLTIISLGAALFSEKVRGYFKNTKVIRFGIRSVTAEAKGSKEKNKNECFINVDDVNIDEYKSKLSDIKPEILIPGQHPPSLSDYKEITPEAYLTQFIERVNDAVKDAVKENADAPSNEPCYIEFDANILHLNENVLDISDSNVATNFLTTTIESLKQMKKEWTEAAIDLFKDKFVLDDTSPNYKFYFKIELPNNDESSDDNLSSHRIEIEIITKLNLEQSLSKKSAILQVPITNEDGTIDTENFDSVRIYPTEVATQLIDRLNMAIADQPEGTDQIQYDANIYNYEGIEIDISDNTLDKTYFVLPTRNTIKNLKKEWIPTILDALVANRQIKNWTATDNHNFAISY
ncbi:MAG: hypothetical protein VX777_09405 [Chlamydiota bacterium]|nr:hypothetical protein [Chlamydiota bacterium]